MTVTQKPDLKVVPIYESNCRDPVATLRVIADDIEAGHHGDVRSIGIVLWSDELKIFGLGRDNDAPRIAMMFQAAIQRFAATLSN